MSIVNKKICDKCHKEITPELYLNFSGRSGLLKIQRLEFDNWHYKPKRDLCVNCFCRILDQLRDEEDAS